MMAHWIVFRNEGPAALDALILGAWSTTLDLPRPAAPPDGAPPRRRETFT